MTQFMPRTAAAIAAALFIAATLVPTIGTGCATQEITLATPTMA